MNVRVSERVCVSVCECECVSVYVMSPSPNLQRCRKIFSTKIDSWRVDGFPLLCTQESPRVERRGTHPSTLG